jgi:ATP dependent DNA ligase domain
MQVIRERDRVRLKTMGGHDYTKRYPWIVEAALKLKRSRFVLDGEAVVLNLHGISDFDALHAGKFNDEVQFYAFDMLADDGDDIRRLRLAGRVLINAQMSDLRWLSGNIPLGQSITGFDGLDPKLSSVMRIGEPSGTSSVSRRRFLSARVRAVDRVSRRALARRVESARKNRHEDRPRRRRSD